MKKILFFAFAASVMASCTTDEVLDLQQNPIAFSNVFVDNSTRAIDKSYKPDSKPKFFVYGTTKGDETGAALVPIFNNVEVKYENSSYNYAANFTQYWIDGNKYNFAALVDAGESTVTLGQDKLPSTIEFTSNSNTDLLYAKSEEYTGKASGNDMVAFTFNHLLSKVHVTFVNGITTNTNEMRYGYKVTEVKIANAIKKATCTLESNFQDVEWSAHNEQIEVSFGNINNEGSEVNNIEATEVYGIGATASATSHFSRLLIPGNYIGGDDNNPEVMDLVFTIETLINGKSVDKRNEKLQIKHELKPGHAYNFIINKPAPEKIEFTVTEVNDWDENCGNDNKPHDVPEQK